MIFNSLQYALFLPAVLLLYWTVLRRHQNALLLVASYVFYGAWDWRFLGLIWVSTLTDYVVGRTMGTTEQARHRRSLLAVSLVVNLGILGFFKYFDFFADSAAELLGRVGLEPSRATLQIVLPVGISFYTFQTLSYTFDIYRRRIAPTRNLLDFAVYVAYFPQLVAGPIERARHLLPQITGNRDAIGAERVRSGLYLILLGLFKKVVIADGIAATADAAFAEAGSASWMTLLVGVYAFALQIYGDFSGYTDIARGSSRLLGIELMENFNQPYLSRNITNFWRTWHISLSTWLRDYLYVPLGGNRGGRLQTYRNLMLTMLLGGLWHGAAWTFVFWGGLHGLYLSLHRRLRHRSPREATDPVRWSDVGGILLTFHAVCFAWIFFRADSFGQAFDYVVGLVTLRGGSVSTSAVALLLIMGFLTLFIDLAQRNWREHEVMLNWPAPARGLALGVMLLGLLIFSGNAPVPFIYFQF